MNKVVFDKNWHPDWKYCYPYDLLEVYGEIDNIGYAYAYENRKANTISIIKQVLNKGDRVLDVAAAQGNFSLVLAEEGYHVTWNDIRKDLANYVEMKREKGVIDYKPGNVFEIDFGQPFDLVLATEIIEHVAHPDEFLVELASLVKPGGYLLFTTPLGSYFLNRLPKFTEYINPEIFESRQFGPNSDDHIFLIHIDEIKYLANKARLDIKKLKYYTNPLTNGHLKLSYLLKVLPKSFVFYIERMTQKIPISLGKKIHNNFVVLLQKK